jgi:ribosomal protein S12 methylthiotransferase accessory factor
VSDFFRLGSSYRTCLPAEVLVRARSCAPRLGITRVSNITRLDRIGIPVYASIRPDAADGSLCVHAGKGLTEEEAAAGAYMEAIEFAYAEYGRSHIRANWLTARDVLDGHRRKEAILDFCPILGATIDVDAPLACVQVDSINGDTFFVPAEIVFLPLFEELIPEILFGSSSNGLCSGSTVDEATVHGLAEVIERDIQSFDVVRPRSELVDMSDLPDEVSALARKITDAGMHLFLRYTPNQFGLPYFTAYIQEPYARDAIYMSGGYGCHPASSIAAVRAICEAAQGRLSFIHGGRDDLVERYALFQGMTADEERQYVDTLVARASNDEAVVAFSDIPDFLGQIQSIGSALTFLVERLDRAGFSFIGRVVLTPAEELVRVVRVVVPGLEQFDNRLRRVGPRLSRYAKECA